MPYLLRPALLTDADNVERAVLRTTPNQQWDLPVLQAAGRWELTHLFDFRYYVFEFQNQYPKVSAPKFTFIWAKRGATLEFEQALQEGVGLGLKPTILWTSHGVMNGASLVLFDFLEGESYVPIRDFFDRIKQLLGDEQPVDLVGAACSLRYAQLELKRLPLGSQMIGVGGSGWLSGAVINAYTTSLMHTLIRHRFTGALEYWYTEALETSGLLDSAGQLEDRDEIWHAKRGAIP